MTFVNSSYSKPFLAVEQQIKHLRLLGLTMNSDQEADLHLRRIGYYRLSGYWYPFRKETPVAGGKRPSEFVPNTSLSAVLQVYNFDENLRAALMSAISRIEVDLRFRIGHLLGRIGPFAHCYSTNLDSSWVKKNKRKCSAPNCTDQCAWFASDWEKWIERQFENEAKSSHDFVNHIHKEYGKPLPIWAATEVMSFGTLNFLLNGLKQEDRRTLAAGLDIIDADGNGDASTLTNWFEHLRQLRNACAHHARVWNRNSDAIIAVPTGVPELAHLQTAQKDPAEALEPARTVRRLYGSLAIMSHLLVRIDQDNSSRDEVMKYLKDFLRGKQELKSFMGFPEDWETQDIWKSSYSRDIVRAEHLQLMKSTPMLATSEAFPVLTSRPTADKQKSLLNYYRRNGALLSAPWTESHSYPSFQFDESVGDVRPIVIEINRQLLHGEQSSEDRRWDALRWWVTPQKSVLSGRSPVDAVLVGVQTEVLEQALPASADRTLCECDSQH